ncbi:MAG: HDOD domain-containing protein [Holophagales bacterium]|jgi:putative nucleotidyltransferase with HDIG domain|nr:HDOD domain-containing protein [Holophagales bacterium]
MFITADLIKKRVHGLPSLPASVLSLTEIAEDERSTMDDVYNVLGKDPVLSASILRLANSPLYNVGNLVSDLRNAIQRLGMDAILNLARSVSIIRNYRSGELLDIAHLWRHSTAVGLVAKAICKSLKNESFVETAFLAGLLHDIGKIVLDRCFVDEYSPVLKAVKEGEDELEMEKKFMDITHMEIGAHVAYDWKFPDNILEVIREHHIPKPGAFLPNLVYYSDLLVRVRFPNGPADKKIVLNLSNDQNFKDMVFGVSGSIPDIEYLTFKIDDEVDHAIGFVQLAFMD